MRKAVRSAKENDFNPRIPLGMRLFTTHVQALILIFQSTHSIRNATVIFMFLHILRGNYFGKLDIAFFFFDLYKYILLYKQFNCANLIRVLC